MRTFERIPALTLLLLPMISFCGGETASEAEATPEPPAVAIAAPAPEPPSIEEAATIIASSAALGDFQFTYASISIPMTGAMENERVRDSVSELSDAGWILLDESGNVTLGEKAEGDIRFLVRQNGFLEIVPLASKEFEQVTGVGVDPNGDVFARFVWRWLPNEIGDSLRSGRHRERFDADHHAKATFLATRSGWEVLLIEEEVLAE